MRCALTAPLSMLALGWGCSGGPAPPRPQWLVYLATDAMVPQVGQELLVELIDAKGDVPSPGLRAFLDGSRPDLWPISFGVEPGTSGLPRIRARLYRLEETGPDGLPHGTALIDRTATLPAGGAGVTTVALTLPVACFGVPSEPSRRRTCDAEAGRLGPEQTLPEHPALSSLPSPARAVGCASSAPAGMKCAPGGTFILGSSTSESIIQGLSPPVPEHLVKVDPFAIDEDEMNVAKIRTLVSSQGLPPPTKGDPSAFAREECTYLGADDPTNDLEPVNCMEWSTAERACQLLGKRLPTEAEWEYAAGNLGLKTSFPWGDDPNVCHYAIVAVGRLVVPTESTECLIPPRVSGPDAYGGTPFRDSTTLGLLNMGGNVREWVADAYDDYAGPCWQTGSNLLVNPVCETTLARNPFHTERGGSWADDVVSARFYYRQGSPDDRASIYVGVRCAKSM